MIIVHPFRKAGEAGDADAVAGLPARNIVFTSPAPAEALGAKSDGIAREAACRE
ncbi:hypothetical protein [Streptomyces cucumeris]|uniref:hypothetical protein n=1 Tax=Streptomyces cucumeris TaxID=2962890 RepID=UPI003D72F800